MSLDPPKNQTRRPVEKVRISPDIDGQRLDNWLLAKFRKLPRSAVYRLLRKGEVRVNGGRKKADYRLQAGDEVRVPPVTLPEVGVSLVPNRAQADSLQAALIFEDLNFLAINKPEGWAVHGGSGVNLGLIEALRQVRDEPNLELAHRIDRDTSGVLLIARRRRPLRLAHEAFRIGAARKRYRVIVQGQWPPGLPRVEEPLERYLTKSGERRVRVSPQGKPSRTDIRIIQRLADATELEVFPHTGRTHQIRVHCAQAGHPVVGDLKYGSDAQQQLWQARGVRRLGLHAEALKLTFPDAPADSGKAAARGATTAIPVAGLDLVAPLGKSFTRLLGQLS